MVRDQLRARTTAAESKEASQNKGSRHHDGENDIQPKSSQLRLIIATSHDLISGSFGEGTSSNFVKSSTTYNSLNALITAGSTALNGTIEYFFASESSGNSYLLSDDNGNGVTDIIQLTSDFVNKSIDGPGFGFQNQDNLIA